MKKQCSASRLVATGDIRTNSCVTDPEPKTQIAKIMLLKYFKIESLFAVVL